MKKIYLLLLSAMVALTACNKEDAANSSQGDLFKLNVATDNSVKVRSVDPVIPDGFELRYILEIYNKDILYKRIAQDSPEMEFRLVTNQAYDFLIWVDYVPEGTANDDVDNHYKTQKGLKAIEMKTAMTNNNLTRDAFFATFSKTAAEISNTANNFSTVECKRPFAQLNVTTTDWDDANRGIDAITPRRVNIAFTAHSKFNVLSKEVSEPVALTYAINQGFAGEVTAGKRHLTCDYIFAPTYEYIIPETKITVFRNGIEITNTDQMLINLPIKRNYKTNVSGKLLTKSGSLTVDVDDAWDLNSPTIVPIEDEAPE